MAAPIIALGAAALRAGLALLKREGPRAVAKKYGDDGLKQIEKARKTELAKIDAKAGTLDPSKISPALRQKGADTLKTKARNKRIDAERLEDALDVINEIKDEVPLKFSKGGLLSADSSRIGYSDGELGSKDVDKLIDAQINYEVKLAKEYGDDYFNSGTGFLTGRFFRAIGDSGQGRRVFDDIRKINNDMGDIYTNEQLESKINKGYKAAGLSYKFKLPKNLRTKEAAGGLLNPEKADLDNDGKLSSYEEARGEAIEKNMREEMFLGGILRLGISGAKSLINNIRKKTNKKEDKNKVDEMELKIEQLEKNYNDTFLPEDSYPLGGAPTDATLKMTREKILKDMDKITSNIEKLSSRVSKQVGGMMMDDQITDMMETEETPDMDNQMANMMPEEKTEEQKAIEEAQAPDEQMEENYVDFLIDEALSDDEETMLMEELQANPQLSILFDKVMEVAMEFSGSGPVEGPGSEVSDSIPARLSDGEFVFTAKAVDVLGADNLMLLMKQAEAQADGRQMAQEGGLMEEEETVMPVQQEPVRQDIRVTKETVGSQASMQEEEDLIGDELKKQMLSGRPHVRS